MKSCAVKRVEQCLSMENVTGNCTIQTGTQSYIGWNAIMMLILLRCVEINGPTEHAGCALCWIKDSRGHLAWNCGSLITKCSPWDRISKTRIWLPDVYEFALRYKLVSSQNSLQSYHDDVIKWKQFPRYLPFVRGIHQPPVNSPNKPVTRSFDVLICAWINGWVTNREAWYLMTPSCSLWRQCHVKCACWRLHTFL